MARAMQRKTLICFFILLLSSLSARGSEIHFKSSVQCDHPLVLLGDVADVLDGDPARAAQLASMALFPAPAPGLTRTYRARQLQEMLALRGLHAPGHQFSGSSKVQITSPRRPVTGRIKRNTSASRSSRDAEQAAVEDRIVVTTRSLRRGERIQPSDVELQQPRVSLDRLQPFDRIEDVIGQEATRSIATGRILEPHLLTRPLIVHRNDLVTVFVRAPGIQIRTTARATADGSQGDLVSVESLDDRDRVFSARVVGINEVEVYARGATVPASTPSQSARRAASMPLPKGAARYGPKRRRLIMARSPAHPSDTRSNP